jgi:hypothetical protein
MLTPEQRTAIGNAIAKKGGIHACSVCGLINTFGVGIGMIMFPLQKSTENGYAISRQSYPCIPLICSNCGNTIFINAVVLGVAEALSLKPAATPTMPPIPEAGK